MRPFFVPCGGMEGMAQMASEAHPELELAAATRHAVSGLTADTVPLAPGLYAWWPRDGPDHPVYVGRALGQKGLRGRIWGQHLRPTYLEPRPEKATARDAAQLLHGVVDGKGRPVVERSAFRKNVARAHVLAPGAPTVAWISERYVVSWVTLEELGIDVDRAKRLEAVLITVWRPRYNAPGFRRPVVDEPAAASRPVDE